MLADLSAGGRGDLFGILARVQTQDVLLEWVEAHGASEDGRRAAIARPTSRRHARSQQPGLRDRRGAIEEYLEPGGAEALEQTPQPLAVLATREAHPIHHHWIAKQNGHFQRQGEGTERGPALQRRPVAEREHGLAQTVAGQHTHPQTLPQSPR